MPEYFKLFHTTFDAIKSFVAKHSEELKSKNV